MIFGGVCNTVFENILGGIFSGFAGRYSTVNFRGICGEVLKKISKRNIEEYSGALFGTIGSGWNHIVLNQLTWFYFLAMYENLSRLL